jgi:hypothetical protein
MRARQRRYLVLVAALICAACQHPLTREEALTAIAHDETFQRLLASGTERVAHETVADCRAMYSSDPVVAEMAGDSAWILLSSAGWLDLADVDAPSDSRQKKHCRAVPTSKADKAAFQEPREVSKSPWTSYWIVETAHSTAEVLDIPADSLTRNSAVAEFQVMQEPTAIGRLLHQPKWTEEEARLFTTTLSGHFRRKDDVWRLESFEEKK